MGLAQNDVISAWYRAELQERRSQRDDAGVVLGFPLWGAAYAKTCLDYELPSMLAPANLAALQAHRAELAIYVDQFTYLVHGSSLPIYLRVIPDYVMQEVYANPGYKYTLMAAVHNLLIHQAAQKGAAFSMGVADHVYSERYFERLLALGQTHDAIVHQALIVSQKSAAPYLDGFRQNGVLSIPARYLGTLGWLNVSGVMKSWLMNDIETFEEMPATHFLVWRGFDTIRIHCPHLTPIWLSNARCRAMPLDIVETIDSSYMGASYMPQASDDMTTIVLDDTRDAPADRISFAAFKEGFQKYSACLPQFSARCMVPTMPAASDFLPDDVIEQRFQKLTEILST